MVIASKVQFSAIALLALSMGACSPGSNTLEFEDLDAQVDPRIAAAQSSIALAGVAVADEDPGDGLAELMIAADLIEGLSAVDEGFCDLGVEISQISEKMLERGAHAEARMGYAIAIHFAQSCETTLPESLRADALRLRQQDARAVHIWALASVDPETEPG
jgi:hypothetical protein